MGQFSPLPRSNWSAPAVYWKCICSVGWMYAPLALQCRLQLPWYVQCVGSVFTASTAGTLQFDLGWSLIYFKKIRYLYLKREIFVFLKSWFTCTLWFWDRFLRIILHSFWTSLTHTYTGIIVRCGLESRRAPHDQGPSHNQKCQTYIFRTGCSLG